MTNNEAIEVIKLALAQVEWNYPMDYAVAFDMAIKALEQEPQTFKWCTDCKEYDQEKHCCHRWSKVIRDTVEEMRQEQEPMVEIDLYSVIKQKYIEREVLDEMRVEVEMEKLEDSPNFCVKANNNAVDRILQIIDKYKAESEAE